MSTCTTCGTHTGTHWPDCPLSNAYDPSYGRSPDTPAMRLEETKAVLEKAQTVVTLAQRKYDEALAAFKKEYKL